jgi:hypothetical protein
VIAPPRPVGATGGEYEVDGEIVQTFFGRDGPATEEYRAKFTVFVKDCSWLIHTVTQDEKGKPITLFETACTNGGEIYEMQTNLSKTFYDGSPDPGNRPGMAFIISNNVPVGSSLGYFNGHIWQMFASSCYFANLATNWLTPVYDPNAWASVIPTLRREAKWKLINGPGSLPSSVVYVDRGVAAATYTATGVTNAGMIQIPGGFVFEQRDNGNLYGPGLILPGVSVPAYHVLRRVVATVTAVRPGCSRSDLLPAAKGTTLVIDYRLSHEGNSYTVTNGAPWLPVEKAAQLYQGKSQK